MPTFLKEEVLPLRWFWWGIYMNADNNNNNNNNNNNKDNSNNNNKILKIQYIVGTYGKKHSKNGLCYYRIIGKEDTDAASDGKTQAKILKCFLQLDKYSTGGE